MEREHEERTLSSFLPSLQQSHIRSERALLLLSTSPPGSTPLLSLLLLLLLALSHLLAFTFLDSHITTSGLL